MSVSVNLKNDPNEIINEFFFDIFSEYFKYEEDIFLFSIVILNFIILILFLLTFFIFIMKIKKFNERCDHIISYWKYRYKNYDIFYKWMIKEFPEKKSITDEEIDVLLDIDEKIEKKFSKHTLQKLVTPKDSKIIKDKFTNQRNDYRYKYNNNIKEEEKEENKEQNKSLINESNNNREGNNYNIMDELKKRIHLVN